MSDSVLVTYATRYGSTKEVAEMVASTLRECGLEVDVQPAQKIRSLGMYSAVVLGVPLYIMRWLKDARRFLSRNQQTLEQVPVAIFILGPTREVEGEWEEANSQMKKELEKYPWLKPVDVQLFGGKYEPSKLRFPDSLMATVPASPLHGAPSTDLRDWDAIRVWAESLIEKI